MFRNRNFYEILELKKDCNAEDIKKSFIKLSRVHHPDKNENSKASHEKFVRINEAYSTLSNPVKRKQYDAFLTATRGTNQKLYEKYNCETDNVNRNGGFSTSYNASSSPGGGTQKQNGSKLIFRMAILRKAMIFAALVLISVISGGVQLHLINSNFKYKRDLMEKKSFVRSLVLEHARQQAKFNGREQQIKNLSDGKLGACNIEELVDQYVKNNSK